MRRDDGVYIGIPTCKDYVTLETIKEKSCCGNKKNQVAYIRCTSRGIMEAEVECSFICKNYKQDFAKSMR